MDRRRRREPSALAERRLTRLQATALEDDPAPAASIARLQASAGNRTTALLLREARGAELMEPVRYSFGAGGWGGLRVVAVPRESPKLGKGENPTYDDAVEYVDKYFERVIALGNLTVEMKDAAFQRFKVNTGKEYNQEDSFLLDMFLAALDLIPAAGPAAKVIASMTKKSYTLRNFVKNAEKMSKLYETTKGHLEKAKKLKEPSEKSKEVSEGAARAEFELQTIDTIADLRISVIEQWWAAEDVIKGRLRQLKNVAPNYDLETTVVGYLEDTFGPMPQAGTLRSAMQEVSKAFELALYKQFYQGSAYWQQGFYHGWDWGKGPQEDVTLEGIPSRVQDRLKTIVGNKNLRQALKDWKLKEKEGGLPAGGL